MPIRRINPVLGAGVVRAVKCISSDGDIPEICKNDTGYPSYAFFNALMSNFFIMRNAAVTLSTF
jgi:hypothetical protein